ncbi:Hypothetical protein D9617_18g033470 [Elsinoe fawcettii]|nr:Hypothetical protein D9617_18g033470 [Elsinoe fawcettii]
MLLTTNGLLLALLALLSLQQVSGLAIDKRSLRPSNPTSKTPKVNIPTGSATPSSTRPPTVPAVNPKPPDTTTGGAPPAIGPVIQPKVKLPQPAPVVKLPGAPPDSKTPVVNLPTTGSGPQPSASPPGPGSGSKPPETTSGAVPPATPPGSPHKVNLPAPGAESPVVKLPPPAPVVNLPGSTPKPAPAPGNAPNPATPQTTTGAPPPIPGPGSRPTVNIAPAPGEEGNFHTVANEDYQARRNRNKPGQADTNLDRAASIVQDAKRKGRIPMGDSTTVRSAEHYSNTLGGTAVTMAHAAPRQPGGPTPPVTVRHLGSDPNDPNARWNGRDGPFYNQANAGVNQVPQPAANQGREFPNPAR